MIPAIRKEDPMIHGTLAARVLRVGWLVAGLAALALTAVHLVNRAWLDTPNLNADVEGNVLTWLNAGAMAAVALVALAFALLVRQFRYRLIVLSAVLGMFTFDELIELHERASFKVTVVLGIDGDYLRVLWPVLYFPLLVFAFVTLWEVAQHSFPSADRAIRLGLLCLVASVGAEMLSATWHLTRGHHGDWPDTIEVAIEEALELGGWILIAFGLTAAAVIRVRPDRLKAGREAHVSSPVLNDRRTVGIDV